MAREPRRAVPGVGRRARDRAARRRARSSSPTARARIDVYGAILQVSFGRRDGFGYVLAIATPLIFSALAVARVLQGRACSTSGSRGSTSSAWWRPSWAALKLDFLPGPLLMSRSSCFAMLGGMAWAAIPGDPEGEDRRPRGRHDDHAERHRRAACVAWALNGPLQYTTRRAARRRPAHRPFPENALVPDLGHLFGIRPIGAPVVAVAHGARRGCRRRVVRDPAHAAGLRGPRGGLVAGLGAGRRHLDRPVADQAVPRSPARWPGCRACSSSSPTRATCRSNYEAGLGFTGIAVAFLGQNNPIGIMFAAILWGILSRGETAAADRDRRATRVHHHPAGHPDPVGRDHVPDRETTARGAPVQRLPRRTADVRGLERPRGRRRGRST